MVDDFNDICTSVSSDSSSSIDSNDSNRVLIFSSPKNVEKRNRSRHCLGMDHSSLGHIFQCADYGHLGACASMKSNHHGYVNNDDVIQNT